MSTTVTAGPILLTLQGDLAGWAVNLTTRSDIDGIHIIDVQVSRPDTAPAPPLALRWSLPCVDLHAQWRGDCTGTVGAFPPEWGGSSVQGRACSQAPVLCLYSASGVNRLTVAIEDAAHLSRLTAGVHEEDGSMCCQAEPFAGARPPGQSFRARLRLDLRAVPWHSALDAVAAWWERAFPPAAVPDAGRQPMYSTWYSLHQAVDAAAIERQCVLARDLGCSAVIIDDGWQTQDGSRGYAYCGDWTPERIPDMAGLVSRLHGLGMRVLLWYSVPFIGFKAAAHARFAGRYLRDDHRLQTSVLDPRYPDVREFLIDLYATALRAWDLDGFKLDFVDSFFLSSAEQAVPKPGMDIPDLDDAVVRLMSDVMAALRREKPDILIEFRQSYVGPVMRTFGHLFRAGDCPADALGNRQRVLDIRVLCRATAAHADMIMWHADEPVESAALQLLNILFAVPQVSVMIDRIPDEHRAMLRFWLGWWNTHRSCLLDGTLMPEHPEARYTQATARTDNERITCLYQQVVAHLADGAVEAVHLVNATRDDGVLISLNAPWQGTLEIHDTTGRIRQCQTVELAAGLHRLPVPAAGLASLLRG